MTDLENGKCPMCGSTLFHVGRIETKITIKCYRIKNCGWTQEVLMTVPEKMPSKTFKELKEHLKPLMKKRDGSWYNPFSESKEPIFYAYRSQALDAAIKFFMSHYYGKKRRNDKLGAEWDVII